ncbi:hypothetical protein MMA231_03486 (plasmid) [Asticcacaulis sp. MM231]|uniref:hypothetical protein n=1 Tax=Asticcacaulis sp. MM231 TaxID=3157666 RepID=UPI0032D57EEE
MKTSLSILALALPLVMASPLAHAASHSITTFIEEQDLNGDGKVSLAELKAGRQIGFMKADLDENGTLIEVEYVGEYEGRLMLKLSKIADPEKRKEEQQRQMRQAKVRFNVLDSDKSGAIDMTEYMASGVKMFERQDRDKDGFVTDKDRILLEADTKQGKGDDFIAP